jgi:hypothetical protein
MKIINISIALFGIVLIICSCTNKIDDHLNSAAAKFKKNIYLFNEAKKLSLKINRLTGINGMGSDGMLGLSDYRLVSIEEASQLYPNCIDDFNRLIEILKKLKIEQIGANNQNDSVSIIVSSGGMLGATLGYEYIPDATSDLNLMYYKKISEHWYAYYD